MPFVAFNISTFAAAIPVAIQVVSSTVVAMGHQWTIADFTNELDHLARLGIASPQSKAFDTMVTTYCNKLNVANQWTAEAVVAIIEKLAQVNLPQKAKDQVASALDQVATKSNSHMRMVMTGQWIQDLAPYLTAQDWQTIYGTNCHDGMHCLAKRLRAMGLTSMKEDTKKQAIGIILHAIQSRDQPLPNAFGIRDFTQKFGAIFEATPAVQSMHGIQRFPFDPRELGDEWLNKAYGQDQRPEFKILENAIPKKMVTCLIHLCHSHLYIYIIVY